MSGRKSDTIKFATDHPRNLYNASLFATLLPFKKPMFEKFPSQNLAINSTSVKLTDSITYEFTPGEKGNDKVTAKNKKDISMIARRRKKDGEWDLTLNKQVCSDFGLFSKIEVRGTGRDLILGGNATLKGAQVHAKVHTLGARILKCSGVYSMPLSQVDLKFGFDGSLGLSSMSNLKYNLGTALVCGEKKHVTTGLSLGHDSVVTLDHHIKCSDYKAQIAAQLVYNKNTNNKWGGTVSAAKQFCSGLEAKAKVNHSMQAGVSIKKTFAPQLVGVMGTIFDLSNPQCAPGNMGIKLTMKL